MRNVTVAAIQMHVRKDVETNIQTAERLVRQAAEQGAQIILYQNYLNVPISVRNVNMTTTSMPSRYQKIRLFSILKELP